MRKYLNVVAGVSLLFAASCSETTQEKTEGQMDTLANKVENAVDNIGDRINEKSDASFVREAIEDNNRELHLLALGQQMATNAELKSAAKKMEADHKKLGDRLMGFAKAKNIEVDMENHTHDLDDDTKGADWDKKWINAIVDEHQSEVNDFEDEQDDVEDAELRGIITEALPTLRSHLEMAKGLQEKMK